MKVEFSPFARRELMRASLWYDRRSPGLGDRLLEEVRRGLGHIKEYPEAQPSIGEPYRKLLLRVFPYSLIYRRSGDRIVVVAVSHVRRRPGYWRRRIL